MDCVSKIKFVFSFVLIVSLLIISCGEDGDSNEKGDTSINSSDDGKDTSTHSSDDTESGTSSDSSDQEKLILQSSHDGWKDVTCRSCHVDAHNPEMNIPGCALCHGTNGAKEGHTSCGGTNAGAGACHVDAHGGEAAGFPAGSCGPCHD